MVGKVNQNLLFEEEIEEDEIEPEIQKQPKVMPKPQERKREGGDCNHRVKHSCIKLGKNVAIDARDDNFDTCWSKQSCNDFEVKGEST